jgi:zinc transport system substrate-binding protein
LVGLLMFLAGCRPGQTDRAGGKLLVAVSIVPQAWLARQVGGDHVEVISILRPGESPHTYQPTDAEVSAVMRAAVLFRIGISFENGPWFQALESSRQVRIVDTRQGIPLRRMESHDEHAEQVFPSSASSRASHDVEGDDHGLDPHIWLSPPLLKIQARTMADTLARLDPAHAADYRRNLEALDQRFDELDAAIREKLAPLRGRAFFVFHPAWGYFAERYGLRQVAIETEGKEPSDRELTVLQQQARQAGIKVIFVQPEISGRAAAAVAQAIGARVEQLDPLYPDVAEGLLRAADALRKSEE